MSREQIDEMARIIGHCESTLHPVIECHNKATGCYCIENPCHNQRIADKLYNAGYRKQIKAEWIISSDGYYPYCSNCKNEPKNGVMTDYCPSCGSDMKGGEE